MAKTCVVLSMAAAVTMANPSQASVQDMRERRSPLELSVTVRVDNNAGVPEPILGFAKARTTEIYRRIRIRLTWLDAQEAARRGGPRYRYTVVLLAPQGERQKAASDGTTADTVGQALPAARRSYVFFQRVLDLVSLPDRDIVTVLGYVMAHELGHLMLPANSHSSTGVMRPNYGSDSRAIPSFTDAQAVAIRKRLADDDCDLVP